MNQQATIEQIIREYIEHRDQSLFFGRKKIDAEKEYNKLLAKFSGEHKHYSLDHANNIYKAYLDMITYGEASSQAESRFLETEERLKEIGNILFGGTITAEIPLPSINGGPLTARSVTVTYLNGQVMVNMA